MRTMFDRSPANYERPLSYAERLQEHWDSLTLAHKTSILLYLASRVGRRLRDDTPLVARRSANAVVQAALEIVRAIRAEFFAWMIAAPAMTRKLRDKLWRKEMWSILSDAKDLLASFACAILATLVFFESMSPERTERARARMVEATRIARAFAPPPCVSDGDGGVWIDVGSRYVRPRDQGYAQLRRELCGY